MDHRHYQKWPMYSWQGRIQCYQLASDWYRCYLALGWEVLPLLLYRMMVVLRSLSDVVDRLIDGR